MAIDRTMAACPRIARSLLRRHARVPRRFVGSGGRDLEEWIPPNQPLSGDQGQSHLYVDEATELRQIEDALKRMDQEEKSGNVDWMETRRKALGSERLLRPDEAKARKHDLVDIEVKEYTLLTRDELAHCIDALGGRDLAVVLDNPEERRMGGHVGMMVCTVPNNRQMKMIADGIVRQLRLRKLHNREVLGAQMGPEGSEDPNETWMVVDCRNYVVHLVEENMRNALRLESIWSGEDGLSRLDLNDEDALDDYVARNPVPDGYGAPVFDWEQQLRNLQKSRFTAARKGTRRTKTGRRQR